jgi:hypothetical protein
MAIRAVEWEVPNADDTRSVQVRRERDKSVRVHWPCGDSRHFTPADAQQALALVDMMAGSPDVWVQQTDSDGSTFACIVINGEFYADTGVRQNPEDSRTHVAWRDLRKAIRRALRDKVDPEPEPAEPEPEPEAPEPEEPLAPSDPEPEPQQPEQAPATV